MSKDLKDYIHYYMGRPYWTSNSQGELNAYTLQYVLEMIKGGKEVQLHLRRLEDMTKEELIGLLQSMVPADMEDKPDEEDYDLELFHNDGGNLVDGDVAVGANYSCSCYDGQIAIRYDGSIDLFDEDSSRQGMSQAPLAFHYLLSKGFDLFGLILAGLAIDSATLTNK